MLKSKVFVKKTRKGGIMKIVREHYLRDDVWCGASHCKNCVQSVDHENLLDSTPSSSSKLCTFPYYLLLDTNIVLHQVDVLEDPIFRNVIILQTVLQEVQHINSAIYKRIRDMTSNSDRKFFVFSNEHHRETYIERGKDESPNDRNDRAIRVAASWYNKHLKECDGGSDDDTRVRIVLLTNDKANKEKAEKAGIISFTAREYVESFEGCEGLADRLALQAETGQDQVDDKKRGKLVYPEHLPLTRIQAGLKGGRYLQGTFHRSRENYTEAYVFVHNGDKQVFIQSLMNLNRAVHEDIVAVEILPKSQWTCPSSVVTTTLTENEKEDDDDVDDDDEDVDKNNDHLKLNGGSKNKVLSGKVIGIIKRNWRPYCGVLSKSSKPQGTRHLFIAAERRIPRVTIETRQASALEGQRIVVSIDSWPQNSKYPVGHFVRKLGAIGDKETENEVLLLERDVPHLPFSAAVQKDLPVMPWAITDEDVESRLDLRHVAVCSIDPPGCTDIDDALHWRLLESGNYEVGVHIADVTHFIRPGTSLDDEAANRGTTVYLTDKRIDMVPGLLSSDLCSLRCNVDRLAFSCIWQMTPQAEIVSTKFTKSIICSRMSFTYAEAQMRIDDPSQKDEITVSLRHLNELAKILKGRRIEQGALTLASPEVRFHIDSETHDPVDLQTKELKETNSLVEEFMLLANICVAKKIFQQFPEFALLRRHPSPPPANYDVLVKAALSKGFHIDVDSAKSLATSLESAHIPDEPYFNTLLRIMATRSMMQALYFCSGMLGEEDFLHYGLATPIYTHFTSPIRRYSDIMVHRLLAVAIGAFGSYPDLLNKDKTQKLCNHLNFRHRMAQYASRDSIDLHCQLFFQNKAITEEEAFVLFVRKNAIQVLIPKYGLEGTVFMAKDATGVVFNEEEPSLKIGDVTYRLFDRVLVKINVNKSSTENKFLSFSLISRKENSVGDGEEPLSKKAKLS
ncbi:exosome complex exonuclease RRP44-like isoform X1 [Montipora capricornis]|uniref:exosome complex exonuclease RRP44-like isoform X1 n=2 Tax=Montipora capricornis TaxID=246305 RepID=UPI0035F183AA